MQFYILPSMATTKAALFEGSLPYSVSGPQIKCDTVAPTSLILVCFMLLVLIVGNEVRWCGVATVRAALRNLV
jgi:hypothetical protein